MDHDMVLSYDFSSQKRRRRQTNAPPSRATLMAMAVCQCDTEHITQYNMTRASPDATGRRHQATICSISPCRPPGRQSTQRCNVPTLLAVSISITMRQYYTARIARWRRYVAFIKATECHHQASTRSDITQPDMLTLVVSDISS